MSRHLAWFFAVILLGALLLAQLGCAAAPTPFATGAEVPPPHGCAEYRRRGGQC